jgi:sarcosine oxidase subunit delta
VLLIRCPYCDMDRPEIEFRGAGQAHIARPADPAAVSDEDWAAYLYWRENPKGIAAERWLHVHGCGRYFNALRHTVTDRVLATYPAGAPRPELDRT